MPSSPRRGPPTFPETWRPWRLGGEFPFPSPRRLALGTSPLELKTLRMFVWSKLSASKWLDAWEDRFHGNPNFVHPRHEGRQVDPARGFLRHPNRRPRPSRAIRRLGPQAIDRLEEKPVPESRRRSRCATRSWSPRPRSRRTSNASNRPISPAATAQHPAGDGFRHRRSCHHRDLPAFPRRYREIPPRRLELRGPRHRQRRCSPSPRRNSARARSSPATTTPSRSRSPSGTSCGITRRAWKPGNWTC